MTRSSRAMQFPLFAFFVLATASLAVPAYAGDDLDGPPSALQSTDPVAVAVSGVNGMIDAAKNTVSISAQDLTTEPPVTAADLPSPTVETPLHHLYCVEYARIRSGFQIFGDAKTWWQKAKNLYAEVTQPAAETVMVFAGSHRITRGHVAVVTTLVGPREIRVDQANWENRGEIDHNTPVLDVSPNNDWSQVRVWDIRSGQFGGHIYAIKGFIVRNLPVAQGS